MKKTDLVRKTDVELAFKRFDECLKLMDIYEPIKKEITKEWDLWDNPDILYPRDDEKIMSLLNKLLEFCPYLYDFKRNEVHKVIQVAEKCIDDEGNICYSDEKTDIRYIYVTCNFNSEEYGIDIDGENNPIIGVRREHTSIGLVRNSAVIDKENFEQVLNKVTEFLKSNEVFNGFELNIHCQ